MLVRPAPGLRLSRRAFALGLAATLGGLTGAARATETPPPDAEAAPKPKPAPKPASKPAPKPAAKPSDTAADKEATPPKTPAVWQTLPPTPHLPAPAASGRVPVKDGAVYYAQFGTKGPPVVMLHGGLANSDYWGHQVALLAKDHVVTVIDTRGHGHSPLPKNGFGYDLFAEDVIAVLDALQISKAAIIGWSDGAITGLRLAISHPDRVERLFSFGANITSDGLIPDGAHGKVFSDFARRAKGEYAAFGHDAGEWSRLLGGMRPVWRKSPYIPPADLKKIKAWTLVSHAAHDEIIRKKEAARIAKLIPGATLEIQEGVSHFAFLQNPGQFNDRLVAFLNHPVSEAPAPPPQ